MSRDELSIGNGVDASVSEDAEVARVLDEYLADLEAGRPADADRLLAEHPAIASQLRACLEVMHLAGRVADESGPEAGNGSDPGSGAMATPLAPSLRATWNVGNGPPPRVRLHDLDDDEPLVRPRSPAMPATPEGTWGRYQLQGEIARGGMGAVIKGRDVDLGRDLAIKVLLESHRGNTQVVRRFIEEAQIGGQLQHPGIVSVYELGTCADRRPYFAMKLVKGRTLASMLQARPIRSAVGAGSVRRPDRVDPGGADPGDPGGPGRGTEPPPTEIRPPTDGFPTYDDLPRFLSIFEQVCQTMAYAHARGVIHRDLKPSNIMVGSFGEVQVMDWGLAKVLARGGVADEAPNGSDSNPPGETVIMTVRTGPAGSGSESQAGSVLGTPAYMAPEQARGDIERLDERADVFGLGAILCEILTGRPPFAGPTREEIRARAARVELADAIGRLDARRIHAELIALAKDCLAAEPQHRPRDAGEVARRISAYRAGVQERLRAAELARADAQARAEEARARSVIERSRRRRTVALAAAVLGLVLLGGGGWAYLSRQRAERLAATTRAVTEVLAEAERFRGQAQQSVGDLSKWSIAVSAARQARDLLAQGEADETLQSRVSVLLADLEQGQAAAVRRAAEVERDRRLLDRLEAIRGNLSEHWSPKQTDIEYAAAFRASGIDLDQIDPDEAARRIARRSAPVELVSYLDDWAFQRRKARSGQDEGSWRRLFRAAQAADPDPWRVGLRDQVGRGDRESLRRLAVDQKQLEAQSIRGLTLLVSALRVQDDESLAEPVLRRAWRLAPDDFWINFYLGHAYSRLPGRSEETIRYYSIGIALRPRSFAVRSNLGNVLNMQGKFDEGIAEYREALRIEPNDYRLHGNLGLALTKQEKFQEAVTELRKALRLNPEDPNIYLALGDVLGQEGKWAEATAICREGLRLEPRHSGLLINLGVALKEQGKLEEAIDTYHEALRIGPNPLPHANLGVAFRAQGEFTVAVAEFRKARDLARNDPRLTQRIDKELTETERLASLAGRLPALLAGKFKPVDAAEAVGFAQVCWRKKLHGASARIWSETFQAQPKLADDMQAQHRYNAACAATLAGCGQGKDDPPLDEAAKTRWRKQAIDWLEADLAAWSKALESGPPQTRPSIAKTLQHWKADADLAGLRDPAALGKLPEDEQKACRALWAEVDALLAKARGGIKPPGETGRLQSAEPSGRLERDHPPPAVDVHHQPAPDQGSQPQERQSA